MMVSAPRSDGFGVQPEQRGLNGGNRRRCRSGSRATCGRRSSCGHSPVPRTSSGSSRWRPAFLVVASVQLQTRICILWPALIALVPMAILLRQVDRRRTVFNSVTYVVVGAACVYWFSITVMSEYPLAGHRRLRPERGADRAHDGWRCRSERVVSGIMWCGIGLVAAEVAVVGAALRDPHAHHRSTRRASSRSCSQRSRCSPSAGAAAQHRHAADHPPRLPRRRARRTAQYRIEAQAAAVMHDTVLGHLAAIAAAPPGPLGPAHAPEGRARPRGAHRRGVALG